MIFNSISTVAQTLEYGALLAMFVLFYSLATGATR
jgi:hypothetical protein